MTALLLAFPAYTAEPHVVSWESLPPLPDAEGFAGMLAGASHGVLIAAGGANFPRGYPWEGGQKAWYDSIFVLSSPSGNWAKLSQKLPVSLAYGVSASYADRLIIVGGEAGPQAPAEALTCVSQVWALEWTGDRISVTELPSLPRPAAHACGAILGSTLYVAGGIESPTATEALHTFWALDLSLPRDAMSWQQLDAWPGPGRMQAVAAVQAGEFYIFSGIALTAGEDGLPRRVEPYLRDAYGFTPRSDGRGGTWTRLADLPVSRAAAPSPALAAGAAHVLIAGGTDAAFQHLDMRTHPGWPRDVLIYHRVTDTWVTVPQAIPEGAARVTAPVAHWRGATVLVSGERSPGRRSPAIFALRPVASKTTFGWFNSASLALYLVAMVLMGLFFASRTRTTEDFFRGGQSVPWWAAGVSIFATMLSSITYMAIPGYAFSVGWNNFLANAYLIITPLVVWVYLPFYRRLNITSAYEYLEYRFNLVTRWLGSLLFMLFQCGRIAVVVLLPSLALATVTDLDVRTAILIMGAVSIIYTVSGGIEAVVWTDVVQSVVLILGALLSLVLIASQVDGGLGGVFATIRSEGRFLEHVSWSWDFTVASAWIIIVGSIFGNLLPYTASQDVVQRYVTTKDEATAARAIWTNAVIALPANALFFVIGSALFAFYKTHPDRLDPTMANDAVFPLFIVRELPAGVAGIVIAGIFAAAQSTLSSSLNSVATCYVTDFHRHFRPRAEDAHYLRVARWTTVWVGVVATGGALVLAWSDVRSLWDAFLEILSLFGGTLAGLFVLGIFTCRANGAGALIGALASATAVLTVKFATPLHFFAYAPIGIFVVVLVGYLASLAFPGCSRPLSGLTVFTMHEKGPTR